MYSATIEQHCKGLAGATGYASEETQAQPEERDRDTPYGDMADALRYAMNVFMEASSHNPVRLYAIMARYCGQSYAEIGETLGMSKQGVQKHLRQAAKRKPAVIAMVGAIGKMERREVLYGEADTAKHRRECLEKIRAI